MMYLKKTEKSKSCFC